MSHTHAAHTEDSYFEFGGVELRTTQKKTVANDALDAIEVRLPISPLASKLILALIFF